MPTMTFGKHKGKDVRDLPDGYLIWCLENIFDCPAPIGDEAARRALKAGKTPEERKAESRKGRGLDRPQFIAEVVGADFRRLRAEFVAGGGDLSACPF